MVKQVLCIPNFSEGRDPTTLTYLRACFLHRSDLTLLNDSADPDHHRSVFTLLGTPDALIGALLDAVAVAIERIDLRTHRGMHPRIGAVDVIPFVPWSGIEMAETAALAQTFGRLLWQRFQLPTYWYEASAVLTAHQRLPDLRRGEFEHLAEKVSQEAWFPDSGTGLHPSAGITVVGARAPLCAYNINLNSLDLSLAKSFAARIRERNGGLRGVRALGLALPHLHCVQVSMNLTDCRATTPEKAYDFIQQLATEHGISIRNTELIGMMPPNFLKTATHRHWLPDHFSSHQLLPNPKEDAYHDPTTT